MPLLANGAPWPSPAKFKIETPLVVDSWHASRKPARSDGRTAATRPSCPPLQREPYETLLTGCPTDAATPTYAPLSPAVPERGAADDLTGDRANSESDACLLHMLYCTRFWRVLWTISTHSQREGGARAVRTRKPGHSTSPWYLAVTCSVPVAPKEHRKIWSFLGDNNTKLFLRLFVSGSHSLARLKSTGIRTIPGDDFRTCFCTQRLCLVRQWPQFRVSLRRLRTFTRFLREGGPGSTI